MTATQTTTPVLASVAPEAEAAAERSELQKRSPVFLRKPKVVLVKILAMGLIRGVYEKPRDDTTIEIKHILQAEDQGVNAFVYRERADTGFCLFQKEEGIRVGHLLTELAIAGYALRGYHWQKQNNKGPVTTFQYVLCEGDEVMDDQLLLPTQAKEILEGLRFNNCTVWCNLRDGDDGGQYRLDTINVAKGRNTPEPSRHLHLADSGKTYRLE